MYISRFFCIDLREYFCALFVLLLPLNFFPSFIVFLPLSNSSLGGAGGGGGPLNFSVLVGIHSPQPSPESHVNHHAGAKFWELWSSNFIHTLYEQKLC